VVAIAALQAAACINQRAAPTVRVSVGPRVAMGPTYLAAERGFFRAEHIDVSLQEVQTPLEALTLVSGGSIEVGQFSFIPGLLNAVARGAHIRIVAGRDTPRPGCGDEAALYYRIKKFPNGPSQSGDWRGARIAISSPNAASEFHIDALLSTLSVSRDAIRISRMSEEDAWAGAAAGNVDVFLGSGRPNLLNGGLPEGVARSDLLERTLGVFQFSYVVFGGSLLDGDPSVGTAFLRAYLRGVRAFVAGDTPQFFNDLARRFSLNADELKNECRDNIEPDGDLRRQDLQRWMTWAETKGYLDPGLTVDQVVDMRFQQAALRTLGAARR
jgi:NitT/TauT family transport system substrate-binding protein